MTIELQSALNLPPIDQIGFVVKDLAQAIKAYEPLFGPFTTMDPGEMVFDYRGVPTASEIRLAFGRSGDVEIELIEWVSGGTPHKEFLDAGREGMQHVRFIVDDIDLSIAQAKLLDYHAIWYKCFSPGLAAAYLERISDPLVIEFFQRPEGIY
jgi:methylmalonyl-CoA/ethylmalonyl-CoA epimerase